MKKRDIWFRSSAATFKQNLKAEEKVHIFLPLPISTNMIFEKVQCSDSKCSYTYY